MNQSGEAADEVVRISLHAAEIALRITGEGAKELAVLLYTVLSQQKKTKGRARLESMLRSGKELKVFTVSDAELKQFAKEAKRYGVLYCVLRNSRGAPDNLCDILVRAEDAAKINRIVERFHLATVEAETVKQRGEKPAQGKAERTGAKQKEQREEETGREETEDLLDALLGGPSPNPIQAEAGRPLLSEPISDGPEKPERGTQTAISKKSVRKELIELNYKKKQEGKAWEVERTKSNSRQPERRTPLPQKKQREKTPR